ncbi:YkgJ family cysteine cluster protein [Helicobacter felis]|uniref:YkgJ family cysteine cluster protein n=1 Tax=Helicobacter felis (strain ATCC 49179 / CCUG 28539 / NCTC 12436 / CS1) TaxID=936155 RepID=E7AD68_HELFC|nr:YkgJ family cysteine cluster protein [Helicobacter felis]CBY82333.1 Putative hypothetical protein/Fe-S-cluster oxidoreductase [Helicobacter felis ATCC 49179]
MKSIRFNAQACASCGARCCLGEGYVFVKRGEIEQIAEFLGMSLEDFATQYLRRVEGAYSLLESSEVHKACVFLDVESSHCRIYPVRPKQCRTYPFWEWLEEGDLAHCPGVEFIKER